MTAALAPFAGLALADLALRPARASVPDPQAEEDVAATFSVGPDLNIPIPDDQYDGSLGSMASSQITASGLGSSAKSITVALSLDHDRIGDLVVKLQGPNGLLVTLLSRPGLEESDDNGLCCCGGASRFALQFPVTFDDKAPDDAEEMDAGVGEAIGEPGNCVFQAPEVTTRSSKRAVVGPL